MTSNIKQKEFWTGPAGKVWVEGKAEKDNMLLPLGNSALNKTHIIPGMKVLDVGCGTGFVSAQLSDVVSDKGQVTGVDISETMIKEAKKYIKKLKITNTIFKVIDVENDKLKKNYYDEVFSRFGVMFFSNPIKAFHNINYSMKSGTFITFVCWQAQKINLWYDFPLNVVKKYIDIPDFQSKAPSPFAFSSKNYIREILNNSNFKNINIIPNEENIELYKGLNLEDAVKEYMHNTPIFKKQFLAMTIKEKKEIYSDLEKGLFRFYKKNVLEFPSKTWIVQAQKQ